jgi:predicted GNAT family acetyltransferase
MEETKSVSEIEIKHKPEQDQFEVQLGDQAGVLQYQILGNRMLITHTEVPPAFEGRGIGSALARAGLDYARERGLEVVPLCSFIAAYIKRHPEYQGITR